MLKIKILLFIISIMEFTIQKEKTIHPLEKLRRNDAPFFRDFVDFVKILYREKKDSNFTFDEAYEIAKKVIRDIEYKENGEIKVIHYDIDKDYVEWTLDCLLNRKILERDEYYDKYRFNEKKLL